MKKDYSLQYKFSKIIVLEVLEITFDLGVGGYEGKYVLTRSYFDAVEE